MISDSVVCLFIQGAHEKQNINKHICLINKEKKKSQNSKQKEPPSLSNVGIQELALHTYFLTNGIHLIDFYNMHGLLCKYALLGLLFLLCVFCLCFVCVML